MYGAEHWTGMARCIWIEAAIRSKRTYLRERRTAGDCLEAVGGMTADVHAWSWTYRTRTVPCPGAVSLSKRDA
jgi:hypothetical protein